MIVGAACGFAGAYLSGSTLVGALCGILAGAAMAAVFGILTRWPACSQSGRHRVAALTILGVGLSGLIGAGFVGVQDARHARPRTSICLFLTDILHVGHASCSWRGRVRLRLGGAGHRHLAVPLSQPPRIGVARRVGDNHAPRRMRSAIRCWASACWRCCSAAAAPAFQRRLPAASAYTPFFIPAHGLRGPRRWIALALVVFASWRPARLVVGAYLFGAVTILQLHGLPGARLRHPLAVDVVAAALSCTRSVVLGVEFQGRAAPPGPLRRMRRWVWSSYRIVRA